MNWSEYLDSFDPIINGEVLDSPYDNAAFIEYTRLNKSRINRWLKTGLLLPEAKEIISSISSPQQWILITEAWCGDAAHSNPFIYLLSKLNPLIELKIILRDDEPEWIENYLTNGNRSIPKLIVRDEKGNDLLTWGPRPAECQDLVVKNKMNGMDPAEAKKITQQWYNADKGQSVQKEILGLITDQVGMRS